MNLRYTTLGASFRALTLPSNSHVVHCSAQRCSLIAVLYQSKGVCPFICSAPSFYLSWEKESTGSSAKRSWYETSGCFAALHFRPDGDVFFWSPERVANAEHSACPRTIGVRKVPHGQQINTRNALSVYKYTDVMVRSALGPTAVAQWL